MAHVPRAIHSTCGHEMQIKKTGISIEMHADWGSYYKVHGDEYECVNPACAERGSGHRPSVILPGNIPTIEHFEPGYADYRVDRQGAFL